MVPLFWFAYLIVIIVLGSFPSCSAKTVDYVQLNCLHLNPLGVDTMYSNHPDLLSRALAEEKTHTVSSLQFCSGGQYFGPNQDLTSQASTQSFPITEVCSLHPVCRDLILIPEPVFMWTVRTSSHASTPIT